MVEEARYLQSFNVSMMVLAQGALPAAVMTSLQAMASSPPLFRAVTDNVTLHALPAIIADVMCMRKYRLLTQQNLNIGVSWDPPVFSVNCVFLLAAIDSEMSV